MDAALREAALQLFVESGLAGFTLEEVARRAGVSRTALYRRWSNRDELIGDALQHWREAYIDLPGSAAIDLPDVIENLSRRAVDALSDPFLRSLLTRVLTIDPDERKILTPYWTQTVAAQRAQLKHAIAVAQDAGHVARTLDPDIAMDAVAGALAYQLLSGGADRPDFDARAYIKRLLHTMGLP